MPENAFVASLNLARPVESFSNGFQLGLQGSNFLLQDRSQQEQFALESARLAEQRRQGAAATAFDQKKLELAERELALKESATLFNMKMSQARASRGGGGSRGSGSASPGGKLYPTYQAAAAAHAGTPFSGQYTDEGYLVSKVWNYGGGSSDGSEQSAGPMKTVGGVVVASQPLPSATNFGFEGASLDTDQGAVVSPYGNAFALPGGGGQPTPSPNSVSIDSLGEGGQRFTMPENPAMEPVQTTPSSFTRQSMLGMDEDQLVTVKKDLSTKVAFLEEQQKLATTADNFPAASQLSAQKVAFDSELQAVNDEIAHRQTQETQRQTDLSKTVYTDSIVQKGALDGKATAEVDYSLPDLVEIYKIAAQTGPEENSRAKVIQADIESNRPLLHRQVMSELSMERARVDSGSRVPQPKGTVGTEALRDPGAPSVSGERANTQAFIESVSSNAKPAAQEPQSNLLPPKELNPNFDPPNRSLPLGWSEDKSRAKY